MIADLLPGLEKLTREQKWQLMDELWDELEANLEAEPASPEILAILEARHQHYLADPSSAMSLDEARRRMLASRP